MRNPKEKSINIDLEVHKKLRLIAFEENITLKSLIDKILRKEIKKREKK